MLLHQRNSQKSVKIFFFCICFLACCSGCYCAKGEDYSRSSFDFVDRNSATKWTRGLGIVSYKGKHIDLNNYFSKPISELFDVMGNPDYQTGWIDYFDCAGISIFAKLYKHGVITEEEVPIKAFAWKFNGEYLVCYCTYANMDMFTSFPISYRMDSVDNHNEWLMYSSENKGLCLLVWNKLKSIDMVLEYSNLDIHKWIKWKDRQDIDLNKYYLTNFVIPKDSYNLNHDIKMRDVIGMDRESFYKYSKVPDDSLFYHKTSLPEDIWRELHFVADQLPSEFRIDRFSHPIDSFDVVYDANDKVIFITMCRQEKLDIQY